MNVRTLNPVLDLELRQRSRTLRSPLALAVYLLLLTAVLAGAHSLIASNAVYTGDPLAALTVEAGRAMFEWVVAAQLALLLLIIPVISAGAIAGERARQTLVPLQVTLLRPSQIFLGKVLSSSAFVLLLMVASAPVLAVPFLVGGVTLGRVLSTLAVLLVISVELTVFGVACSSFFKRTQTATLGALFLTAVLVVGPFVAMGMIWVADAARGVDEAQTRPELMYLDPLVPVIDVAGDVYSTTPGPFTPVERVLVEAENQGPVTFFPDGSARDLEGRLLRLGGSARLLISLAVQVVVTAGVAALGIRRLRAPAAELPA